MADKQLDILILEDDEVVAKMLQNHIVENWGDRCDVANSYKEAVEKSVNQYDAVITDIILKGEDKTGYDFIEHYWPDHPYTKIVVLSARDDIAPPTSCKVDLAIHKPSLDLNKLQNILHCESENCPAKEVIVSVEKEEIVRLWNELGKVDRRSVRNESNIENISTDVAKIVQCHEKSLEEQRLERSNRAKADRAHLFAVVGTGVATIISILTIAASIYMKVN